jgi:hypothetical protein
MALEQRNETRFIARVGTWIRAAIFFIAEVLESLLNIKEEDALQEKSIKAVDFVLRRGVYFAMDNGLTALSILIGGTMKVFGSSLLEMFLALWLFDFVAAGLFVAIYEVTGKDLSLGEDLRRATDTVNGKSRFAGFVAMLGVIFLAIVWTGPEKIIVFFRKEIGTINQVLAVLVTLTAIQAFIWAVLYWHGYDLAVKAF